MAATEFQDFEIEMDLTDVDAFGGGGGPLVAPGAYELDILDVKQQNSKTSGNAMIVVTFQVPDDAETSAGARLWGNYSLQPQALGRLKQLMIACGADLTKFKAAALIGCRIKADVVHNEGQAQIGPDGNARPAKTFANVVNEQPLEAAPEPQKPAAQPPVTKAMQKNGAGGTTGKPAGTAPRRQA